MKTRSVKRKSVRLASSLLAVATGSFACSANANAQPGFTLVEHAQSDSIVVHAGPARDNAGDVMTFANPVFDSADQKQLGGDAGYCLRVKPSISWHCHFTVFLDGGSITVDGISEDAADTTVAIVGGTGRFAEVTGTMRLHGRDKKGSAYDFSFVLK